MLIAQAVYDQGIYGIFTDKNQAVEHGNKLIDESDYHHGFRVESWLIDAPKEVDYTLRGTNSESAASRRVRRNRPNVTVIFS